MGVFVHCCFILSVFGTLLLPIWGYMLLNDSLSFEMQEAQRRPAGISCMLSAFFYCMIAVVCGYELARRSQQTREPVLTQPRNMTRKVLITADGQLDLITAVHEFVHHSFSGQSDILSEVASVRADEDALAQLRKRFLTRLPFGTAGLRGPMGGGFNNMNDLVVLQTTQGVAEYLLQNFDVEAAKTRGFVLGYDGRYNSKRFAHVAAAALLSKGFKVYLNSRVTATPMNPYLVVKYKTLGGVQVTASHNPKNDNGYKLYHSNGAQIFPPMDEEITGYILKNLQPWEEAVKLLDTSSGLLKDVSATIDPYETAFNSYMEEMAEELVTDKAATEQSGLKIVYTAMHGVGLPFVQAMLEKFGYSKLIVVPEQALPNPEFPTVAFPNPEEKGALDLATATADKENCELVIANDPDADRFAFAEKQADGKWRIFHGDEIGILLGQNMLERAKKRGVPTEKMLFINSTVSSRMLEKMATVEGARYEDTMTGFKWMMNRALELRDSQGLTPVFVYEEALGYAVSAKVPDKDGVTAAGCFVEMACSLHAEGKKLSDKLDELRQRYGYFISNNSYFLCYDKAAIDDLFAEFRNGGKYRRQIGSFAVKRIRDVTTGYDDGQPDGKCLFPLTPSAQMITLFFDNGAVFTLRTSGTEPKLKWYSELSASDPAMARDALQKVVDAVIEHVLQPQKYPLHHAK